MASGDSGRRFGHSFLLIILERKPGGNGDGVCWKERETAVALQRPHRTAEITALLLVRYIIRISKQAIVFRISPGSAAWLEAGDLCGCKPNLCDGEFTPCEAELELEAESWQVQAAKLYEIDPNPLAARSNEKRLYVHHLRRVMAAANPNRYIGVRALT